MSRPVPEALVVAAFTALREEISRRSTAQLQLITTSFVGFTTLTGIVLAAEIQPQPFELLLLVPLLSGIAGLLWLDHDRRIREIGDYINDQIFLGATGSFEERADQLEATWTTRVLGFLVPTIAVFLGPATVSLLWTYKEGVLTRLPALWWSGMVLSLLFCLYFLRATWTNAKARTRHSSTSAA